MSSLYIHFPFCQQKCSYCGFYSIARVSLISDFVSALKREIRLQAPLWLSAPFKTLYFGGGTPSMLPPVVLQELIDEVSEVYGLAEDAEITLEANPNHLTESYFQSLRQTRINRLSIGVQSFFDEDLRRIRRMHTGRQAEQAMELADRYGFRNLSVDLMYGLPDSSLSRWKANLQKVASVPHLSCYQLTLEEGTLLYRQQRQGTLSLPDEEEVEAQYRCLMEFATAHSFRQYEISNFCKGEAYSRHNRSYWRDEPYAGFGPGAHAYTGDFRQYNVPDVSRYIQILSRLSTPEEWKEQLHYLYERECLTQDMKYNEYVMTSLRTCWGCDLSYLRNRFGDEYEKHLRMQLRRIAAQHYLLAADRLRLTPSGMRFADGIAATLFV